MARFDKKLAPESKTANHTRSIEAPQQRGKRLGGADDRFTDAESVHVDEDTVDAAVL
jgi:hypothetical protein